MSITIDQALAFCTVVESGGYTQAAQRLNRSHTSIIYLIKSLEAQLAVKVFNRDKYRNRLTTVGERVYHKCKEILGQVGELDAICAAFNDHWESSLKIVFDGILPIAPFIDIYKDFKAQEIPTVVQTYTDYLQDVEKTFDHLNADMMISLAPVRNKDLQSIDMDPLKIVLVSHSDHPIQQTNRKWTTAELKQFYFLTVRGDVRPLGLNTSVFEQSASFFLSDFSFKKEAILKKLGFGWLPAHLIESELKRKILRPVKWEKQNENWIQPVLYLRNSKRIGRSTQLIKNKLTQLKI